MRAITNRIRRLADRLAPRLNRGSHRAAMILSEPRRTPRSAVLRRRL